MKKVLIITYYWPPSAGSGVQRWLKFSKYLPNFGWGPVIFTPENPDFHVKDETLLDEVHARTEVIRFPIWEPYSIFKQIAGKGNTTFKPAASLEKEERKFTDHVGIWIRGNLLIPDPRVFWVKPSVNFISDILENNQIDIVITTGPPHSIHLIGLKLKRKTGIKWLADFRDPWSKWDLLDTLYMTNPARKIHKRLEKKVLKNADGVITISNTFKEEFEGIAGRKVEVITNGYDPEDFKSGKILKAPDKFRVSHVGTIDELRNPRYFFKAASELCAENADFKADLEIFMAGVISKRFIHDVRNDAHLKDLIIIKDYMPHQQLSDVYRKAAVLLLVLASSHNAKGNIPGKLFEYLATGKPILALGAPNGDSAKIIKETNAGKVCALDNVNAIKKALLELYKKYKAGLSFNPQDVSSFSRENLTKELVQIMNSL